MVSINIDITGLKELEKDFGPDVIKKTLNKAIKKSTLVLEAEAKKESPIDRGQLRAGFQTKFSPMMGILQNTTKYAGWVQNGTKPHTPPWKPIEDYARRKGIPAFALWYSIKRKGTKPNNYMGRALKKSEAKINTIFQRETNALVAKLNR